MKSTFAVLFGLVVAAAAVTGCSGGEDSSPTVSTTTSAVSTAPAPTPTHEDGHPGGDTTAPVPGPTTGQRGADGSTGNNLSDEYCARNQDPGCPLGSYIGPDAIPNPNGDGTWVPCEGTICTNPNHGGGPTTPPPAPTTTPVDTGQVEGGPCGDDGLGRWTHLDGDNAGHYGTEWLCSYN
ncbi:hypothetical protein ACFVVM_08415 [Nocardia sp. NPDC058176]|uniref:hypothetical protein n=1 Tax=Nocardia sp. NPDC058176 TaxID=3346368 RepID=UPI0036D8B7CA